MTAANPADAAGHPAPSSAEPEGGAGDSRGPTVRPMTRETRAASAEGYSKGIRDAYNIIRTVELADGGTLRDAARRVMGLMELQRE